MSELHNADRAPEDSHKMDAGTFEQEQKRMQTSNDAVASSSFAAAPTAAAAEDARVQRLARRSQMRDDAERDAPERERRRLEALEAKAVAREARRAAALAAQAVLWRSFGPAQRLFADGIASILSFLELDEFVEAAQTCKSWREAAKRVRTLGSAVLHNVAELDLLPDILASPFHRLVRSVIDISDCISRCWNEDAVCDRRLCDGSISAWTHKRLHQLQQLEELTELSIRVDPNRLRSVKHPFMFPLHLRCVNLRLVFSYRQDPTPFDGAILLRNLLLCESLVLLEINLLDYNPIDLTILSEFKQLLHLRLGSCGHFDAPTLVAVKQLPLQSLGIAHNDEDFDFVYELDWIAPLLTTPHQLGGLEELELEPAFEWNNTQLNFASLPSLTSLTPSLISVALLPSLAAFPKLRTLSLSFNAESDWLENELGPEFKDAFEGNLDVEDVLELRANVRVAAVLPHLTNLTALTSLQLDGVSFAANDLATLCRLLPRLEELTLGQVSLSSLRGVATLHQLRKFDLFLNDGCSVSESDIIEQIGACKQLEQLSLSGIPPLSPLVYEQLNPPSALLPHLHKFELSSPAIHS